MFDFQSNLSFPYTQAVFFNLSSKHSYFVENTTIYWTQARTKLIGRL